MNKKYFELIINTVIFTVGTMGSKLILFFMVPLYTNHLSSAEYGTADLVQTVSTLCVPIISIMIQDAVLRFGLSKEVNKETILKNALLIAILGGIIGIFLIPLLRLYNPISKWAVYLYFIIFTNMISNILFAYIKTVNKNKLYSLCGVLSTFILAMCNLIFLLVFNLGIRGYLLSIILSESFNILFLFFFGGVYLKIFRARIDRYILKQMVLYSIPLIVNNLSWWILNASDKIMIEYYTDISHLGLYTAASKIPALISVINGIFLQAWTISSIKNYEVDKDTNFCSSIFKYYSTTMFFAIAIFMLILKKIMGFYVGVEYQVAWKYVPLLLYGSVFYGFSLFFGTIYSAAKKNINIAISTAFAAIINIFINVIFLPKFGVISASVSTFISYFVVGIYRMINSRKILMFDIQVYKFLINCTICLIQTVVVTIDFYSTIFSLMTIIVLVLNNIECIIYFSKFIFNIIKRKNKFG